MLVMFSNENSIVSSRMMLKIIKMLFSTFRGSYFQSCFTILILAFNSIPSLMQLKAYCMILILKHHLSSHNLISDSISESYCYYSNLKQTANIWFTNSYIHKINKLFPGVLKQILHVKYILNTRNGLIIKWAMYIMFIFMYPPGYKNLGHNLVP